MADLQIQMDMRFLAGRLAHRGSNTENERVAAEFLRDRFREYTPDIELDEFYSPDTPWYLFASYYMEFTVVAILAVWWPRIALCYGSVVFLAYLAEHAGYRLMGRFVPQYETQNVVARFLAPRPSRLFVVMAHYDSGKAGPLSLYGGETLLRGLQVLATVCMLLVILTCAIQAVEFSDDYAAYNMAVRWSAVFALITIAAAVAYNELQGDYVRGANDNASGAAVLLHLAEQFASKPIENADVWMVATGSNYAWMNGARHFVNSHEIDRDSTFFLNIDGVGSGTLAYTKAVGMLAMTNCSRKMLSAAREKADAYGAVPCRQRTPCSDVLIPLLRGFDAMEVTSTPLAAEHVAESIDMDRLTDIDFDMILRAANFSESVIRLLADTSWRPLRDPEQAIGTRPNKDALLENVRRKR